MNILMKSYCRIFQFCLKVALPLLPYRDPKVINSTDDLYKVVEENKKCRPLVISDKTLTDLGLAALVTNNLNEHNISYEFFNDVEANPTTRSVEKALEVYNSKNCDMLIAVGGGSVIDLAKAVGARKARKRKPLSKMKGILKVMRPIPLLVAIPSTSGTGSETTLASVIVDSETRHKYAINDFPLIPRYALLDVRYVANLPKFVYATTGMDALTHAIEAFVGRGGNKKTRSDALNACKLIFENFLKGYDGDLKARENMLLASFLAGRSFSKAYVGNVHALAHSLGGKYNTAHGLANAVILPLVLEDYGKAVHHKLASICRYCEIGNKDSLDSELAALLTKKIKELNSKTNIPTTLRVDKEDLVELSTYAYKEANPLYPVPVMYSKEKMIEMYKRIGDIHE